MRLTPAVAAACVTLFVLGGSDATAWGPHDEKTSRPTDPDSLFAYETRDVKRYFGSRAVIHYVTVAPDAPPRADEDRDQIPDYVEDASAIADSALEYFERPRACFPDLGYCLPPGISMPFRKVRPDKAGADSRPDVYIKSGVAGLGTTISPRSTTGGAFVVISPTLDARWTRPRSGLLSVLAHEMFHLVEFTYVPKGMPAWISEGSANAMAAGVASWAGVELGLTTGALEDAAIAAQLDLWLRGPWRSIYSAQIDCLRCYGNLLWWSRAFTFGNVLQRFYERAGRHPASIGLGVRDLDATFRGNKGGYFHERSLYDAFAGFSREMFERQEPGMLRPLSVSLEQRITPIPRSPQRPSDRPPPPGWLSGLSTHYVPLVMPADARGVRVRVETEAGRAPQVFLFVGEGGFADFGRRTRAIPPSSTTNLQFMGRPGRVISFGAEFADPVEKQEVVLMIASRRSSDSRYRLVYGAT